MAVERGTRVVARWIPLDDDRSDATRRRSSRSWSARCRWRRGEMVTVRDTLTAPAAVGRWALVIDVVDDVDGSYAALGSEPAVAEIDVVAARGRDSAGVAPPRRPRRVFTRLQAQQRSWGRARGVAQPRIGSRGPRLPRAMRAAAHQETPMATTTTRSASRTARPNGSKRTPARRSRSSASTAASSSASARLRQLPIALPAEARTRELPAAQRDPRRHDDPLRAVQEGALERGRPDLLPAPPAVRQARRGAARARRRDRRARPDAGRDQRRRPAPRGRADDDRARRPTARRRSRSSSTGCSTPTRRSSRRSARASTRPRSPRTWARTTC